MGRYIDDKIQFPNGIPIKYGRDLMTRNNIDLALRYMYDHNEGGELVKNYFNLYGLNPPDNKYAFYDYRKPYPSKITDFELTKTTPSFRPATGRIDMGGYPDDTDTAYHEAGHGIQKHNAPLQMLSNMPFTAGNYMNSDNETASDVIGAGGLLYDLGLIKSPTDKIKPIHALALARILNNRTVGYYDKLNGFFGDTSASESSPIQKVQTAIAAIEKTLSSTEAKNADPNEVRALQQHLQILKNVEKDPKFQSGNKLLPQDVRQLLYHNDMIRGYVEPHPLVKNYERSVELLYHLCPERFDLNGNDKLTGKPVDFNLAVQSLNMLTRFNKKKPKFAKAAAKRLRKALLLKKDLKSKQIKGPSSEVKPVITRKPFIPKIKPKVRKLATRRFNRPVIQRQPIQNAIPNN